MRVIVTGASGFIGSHLATFMAREGHSVLALDRHAARPDAGVSAKVVDLLDASALISVFQNFQPEVVLHLGARTDLKETRFVAGYAANMQGVHNVLEAIRMSPTVQRAVCTSSQLVCRVGYKPAHDEDFAPNTIYGESKVKTERIWRSQDGAGHVWAIVRPTTIWGPRMNPHYLRFFRMIRDGWYVHVSGGPTLKSYGYVGNTVAQYAALVTAPAEQVHRRVFYLADYDPLSLEEWAEAFRAALAAPPIRTIPRAVAMVAARLGDAVNALGFHRFPFNSFRLRNVLTSYQANIEATREICALLPFSMAEGVAETVHWLHSVWQSDR